MLYLRIHKQKISILELVPLKAIINCLISQEQIHFLFQFNVFSMEGQF